MSAQSSFTAGPWKMLPKEADRDYIRIRGARLSGRYKVANVLAPVYQGIEMFETAESLANARLIAAAPELLAELQNIASAKRFSREHFADDAEFGDWVQSRARAAITRATQPTAALHSAFEPVMAQVDALTIRSSK